MDHNPWQHLPEISPFVLPDDEPQVRCFNSRARPNHVLRIDDVLPEPFVGTPEAPVLLLGNNPGFSERGLPLRQSPPFVTRMRDNLLHRASKYPFVYLDPNLNGPSKVWWKRKLNPLLARFSVEVIARAILAVEYFPYSSHRYRHGRLRLASQDYSFHLVRSAITRKAEIVLTRGKKRWLNAVPELEVYDRFCELRNKQRSAISPGNCPRFQEVIQAIEATTEDI